MDIASQAARLACLMRITKEQLLARYPALKVRAFLRSYRIGISVAPAAEEAFQVDAEPAADLLVELGV
jgi:hypothetical protein